MCALGLSTARNDASSGLSRSVAMALDPRCGGLPALADEGGDQPVRLVLLGVPEHAEHEAALRVLNRLDRAVALRARRRAQAVADARDALMVVALDRHLGRARGQRREAARLDLDAVLAPGAVGASVD